VSLYAPRSSTAEVRLRPATPDDAGLLAGWDREPHVIACSTDDPNADIAFGGIEWREELSGQSPVSFHLIAELDGRPIGAMQVIDPHLEPTHYWGEIEPNLRAIDIWIGPKDALNRGYGTRMMTLAIDDCFAAPEVTAIVIDPLATNTDAHRFYQRLGFEPVGRRMFDTDDCLVHRLERATWEARPRP
jgi:aminoglycoside 6'-N-acetyltransferase